MRVVSAHVLGRSKSCAPVTTKISRLVPYVGRYKLRFG
jgi:hypothetical protein